MIGHVSLLPEKWQHDAREALKEFCDKVDTLWFKDRVIGYFLAAGGTSEWYPAQHLRPGEK